MTAPVPAQKESEPMTYNVVTVDHTRIVRNPPAHYNPSPMFGLRTWAGWRSRGFTEWVFVRDVAHDRDTTLYMAWDGNEPRYFASSEEPE